ncbi:Fibrinogen-like protein 1,Fibrinogen-like protein A,Tenascin,Ryncolin-2,Ryncolin-4,Tenascin-N,Angiopoietin-related protein 7,Ficolin-2,Ryncolin-1,Ryncolin-3,Ficolin-1,Fibroleukin,Fibrinogen C domain-containing protein 1 [Mytilus coruscus]|uniref:Fibrinogen C-terminal domain-containing protein n=1 Tax=Mytilus coruscus TaxID=42192 RepID=A0A6J8EW46_MYTCO|nr:Fibrinogen-like protein 1,Fibrinogen-like protein A,Tenascin,Ryncolin-2,Ryncolin-4,Tenascin-N,Angiopoietin-related protein 7,Ficolin-2,Ryncolin-1,Ryncolin-3,Ficolin-1,Fibroleukin,Fibrinogen C domain-containing protein 1 [Mytilus coruscus]
MLAMLLHITMEGSSQHPIKTMIMTVEIVQNGITELVAVGGTMHVIMSASHCHMPTIIKDKMARHISISIILTTLSVLVASDTILNKHLVKSSSDSGVCLYGATAERVLNILATGKFRTAAPSVRKPKDCSDLDPKHDPSGVYRIFPTGGRGFKVYCDMTTDGGRWTVLIRRMDGSQDFNKKWSEYENGFGDLNREFWLGNKYLHTLTSIENTEMRVDMDNFKGEKRYAKYSTFQVGDAGSKYKLTIGGFSGNVGDAFPHHNGMKFTTPDQDNDLANFNCAVQLSRVGGGWWFGKCDNVCFTFSYANNKKGLTGENLIQWVRWKGSEYSLKYAAMMIRRG